MLSLSANQLYALYAACTAYYPAASYIDPGTGILTDKHHAPLHVLEITSETPDTLTYRMQSGGVVHFDITFHNAANQS